MVVILIFFKYSTKLNKFIYENFDNWNWHHDRQCYFCPFIKKKLKQWKNTKMVEDRRLTKQEMREL